MTDTSNYSSLEPSGIILILQFGQTGLATRFLKKYSSTLEYLFPHIHTMIVYNASAHAYYNVVELVVYTCTCMWQALGEFAPYIVIAVVRPRVNLVCQSLRN